jgi:hypothetical protein
LKTTIPLFYCTFKKPCYWNIPEKLYVNPQISLSATDIPLSSLKVGYYSSLTYGRQKTTYVPGVKVLVDSIEQGIKNEDAIALGLSKEEVDWLMDPGIYHPMVHDITVVENAREDIPISHWKESGSELTSQRLEVLELRRKPRDNVLESILTHMALLCVGNFCICPSIPTSQYICLWSYLRVKKIFPPVLS